MGFIHFLQLILIVAILLAVGVPLFGKLKLKKLVELVDPAIDEFKHLLVRKEETLISIKELEFDFNTEKISERILSLPMYPELTKRDINEITDVISEFFEQK